MEISQKTIQNKQAAFKRERIIIGALIFLGVLRVFLYNTAFPPFNNVDELAHFDLVLSYSRDMFPDRALQKYRWESVEIAALYGSPEYLNRPEIYPQGRFPQPLWSRPNIQYSSGFYHSVLQYTQKNNHETDSFPVYYMGAGIWCALGRMLGAEGGSLVFWVRFLNVPLFALLIWLSYQIACFLFPDKIFFRIGLPLMTAFFPQDLFFTINSDTFSPLFFTAAFYMLLKIYLRQPSPFYYFITGLVAAATFLVKVSNFPVMVLLAVVIGFKGYTLYKGKKLKQERWSLLLLIAAAVIPIGLWMLRCHSVFGNWTGSIVKAGHLGWSIKSFSALTDHPIFSAAGLKLFLADLARTFWRGELFWHSKHLCSPLMDYFYIFVTGILLGVSIVSFFLRRITWEPYVRGILILSMTLIVISVIFMALISICFDFGNCYYPSRKYPFFTSGRLIFCTFIPFLLLFMHGLRCLFFKYKESIAPLVVLIILVIVITVSEMILHGSVFTSQYNWYHLP